MGEKVLTCGETALLMQALQELSAQKMRPKLAFWVARTIREIEPTIRALEEQRLKLVEKHAVRDEKNEYVFLDRETGIVQLKNEFWPEYDELLSSEGTKVRTCTEQMLIDGLEDSISPTLLQKLMIAVEDTEKQEAP
jgi:hypothetical protein